MARGEVVVAFVVAKEGQTPTTEALRDFCKKQGLPGWKIPREITVVEDLHRARRRERYSSGSSVNA